MTAIVFCLVSQNSDMELTSRVLFLPIVGELLARTMAEMVMKSQKVQLVATHINSHLLFGPVIYRGRGLAESRAWLVLVLCDADLVE